MIIFNMVTVQYSLPPGLLMSLCTVESGLHAEAIHRDDGTGHSIGICQLHYDTASDMGFRGRPQDLFKAESNILYAGKYLCHQLDRHRGNIYEAVASYNAGRVRYNEKGQIKNRHYVDKVLKVWRQVASGN